MRLNNAWSAIAVSGMLATVIYAGTLRVSAQTRSTTSSPTTYNGYTGTDVRLPPSTPTIGGANTSFVDPDYLTKILRVTDQNTAAGMSFIPTDAGFTRTFNANSTAIKLQDPQGFGYWEEFSASAFKVGDGSSRPVPHKVTQFDARWEWSAVNPDVMYYLTGSQIAAYNKATGTSTTIASTPNGDPTQYHVAVIGQDAWVCAAAGAGVQDTYTEIFCANPSNPSQTEFINVPARTINGTVQTSATWPTSASGLTIGIHGLYGSVGGAYLGVTFHQQSWGANGDAVLNLSTNTWSLLTNGDPYWSGHVSIGNGRLVNGGGSIDGRDSRGAVVRDPDDLMNPAKLMFIEQPPSTYNWLDGEHNSWFNSASNPNAPVLFSRYTITSSPWLAWMSEIVLAATDGSNTVWRIAHTHQGGGCYYGEAFAQISNDGQWALFSSYWDGTLGAPAGFDCASRVDTFLVQLPTGASQPPPPAAPSVAMTAPTSGATVTGTATLSASASSSIGIAGVQFQVDGANIGSEVTTAPYTMSWDSTSLADGSHSLGAVARDTAGTTSTSGAVSITVSNAAPPPPPPPPPPPNPGNPTNPSNPSPPPTPWDGSVPVQWTNLHNVTVTGTTLQKTSGCAGCADAAAVSSQAIASGDGFLEFTASELETMRAVGLTRGNPGTRMSGISFAILLQDGDASVQEKGSYRADVPFAPGDVFRIAVKSKVVTYAKNGTVFYTSKLTPQYPMDAAAILDDLQSTITNASITVTPTLASVQWTSLVNASPVLSALVKSGGCDGCQDAGAISTQAFYGDGYVEFKASTTSYVRALGLNTTNPGTTIAEMPFALELNTNDVEVLEYGVYKADVRFTTSDTLRIAVTGGHVTYSKNGVVFYTSTASVSGAPLFVDTSLLSAKSPINSAVIFGALAPVSVK